MAPQAASVVVVKQTGEDGQRYVLEECRNWCTLGSHPECDIIIHSRGVANLHALVVDDAENGAKLFGLDDNLPTVFPGKKTSLFKDDGALLENCDVFIIGERHFRFEYGPQCSPRRQTSSAAETLADKTNIHPNMPLRRRGPATEHSFAPDRRRNSLVVKKDIEEFQQPARTSTLLTARRMSLPASAVAQEFFANMVSPSKKKAPSTQRVKSQFSPHRNRSPLLSKSAVQSLRRPSVCLSSSAARAEKHNFDATPITPRHRAGDVLLSMEKEDCHITPPARQKFSVQDLERRQTPLRAKTLIRAKTPTRDKGTPGASSRLQTPRRSATQRNLSTIATHDSGSPERLQTPRRAITPSGALKRSVTKPSDSCRLMTPKRAPPASQGPTARKTVSSQLEEEKLKRLRTPQRALTAPRPIKHKPDSNLSSIRRALSSVKPRNDMSTPVFKAETVALTPRNASGELQTTPRTKDRHESIQINKRVAAESPLFQSQAKRARTSPKPARAGPSHRDALAFVTPVRRTLSLKATASQPSGSSPDQHTNERRAAEDSSPAAKELALAQPGGASMPEPAISTVSGAVAKDTFVEDSVDSREGNDDRSDRSEVIEREPIPRQESMLNSQDILDQLDVLRKSLEQGLDDAQVDEELPLHEEEKTSPLATSSKKARVPVSLPTPSRRQIPKPAMEPTDLHDLGESLSFSRVGKRKANARPASLSGMPEEENVELLFAGITPAAGMVPRTKTSQPATESWLGALRRRPETPERQIRHASKLKECLSQKPRSAISKSTRKGRRRSVAVQKTVLFADSVGANIELASGPHYSPPPKARSPLARSSVAGSPVANREKSVAPMMSLFNDTTEEPSAARFVPEGSPSARGSNQTSSMRAVGPPPNSRLGALGLFFYPTKPVVPLLTNGPPQSTGSEKAKGDAKVDEESQRSTDSFTSSDQALITMTLPFTESESAIDVEEANEMTESGSNKPTPPRRRSLLGGLASFGGSAASSVLRRLSGVPAHEGETPPDVDVEQINHEESTSDDVSTTPDDVKGNVPSMMADIETRLSSSENGRNSTPRSDVGEDEAMDYDVFETDDDGEESNSMSSEDDDGVVECDAFRVDGSNESVEPGKSADNNIYSNVLQEEVPAVQEEIPRRRSLLGIAYDAIFSGSAKKSDRETEQSQTLSPRTLVTPHLTREDKKKRAEVEEIPTLEIPTQAGSEPQDLNCLEGATVCDEAKLTNETDDEEENMEYDSTGEKKDDLFCDAARDTQTGNMDGIFAGKTNVGDCESRHSSPSQETPKTQSLLGRLSAVFRGSAKIEDSALVKLDPNLAYEAALPRFDGKNDLDKQTSSFVENGPSTSETKSIPKSEKILDRSLSFVVDSRHVDPVHPVHSSRASKSKEKSLEDPSSQPNEASPRRNSNILCSERQDPKLAPPVGSGHATPANSPTPFEPGEDFLERPSFQQNEPSSRPEEHLAYLESSRSDYSSWTVRELRELLIGLGHSCQGLRKAALVDKVNTVLHGNDRQDLEVDGIVEGDAVANVIESQEPQVLEGRFVPDVVERNVDEPRPENMMRYTVSELREMLRNQGLDTAGRKAELIDRLQKFAFQNDPASSEDENEMEAEREETEIAGDETVSDTVFPPINDYSTLLVKELRALCDDRGISTFGKKQDLIDRLNASDGDIAIPDVSSISCKEQDLVNRMNASDGEVATPDISSMTVAALRYELSKRSLKTGGKKDVLKARLTEALGSLHEETPSNDHIETAAVAQEPAKSWETTEAKKMTVAKLRAALLANAMCGVGNKARLVTKVEALQKGIRVTRRNRDLLMCAECERGNKCEAQFNEA